MGRRTKMVSRKKIDARTTKWNVDCSSIFFLLYGREREKEKKPFFFSCCCCCFWLCGRRERERYTQREKKKKKAFKFEVGVTSTHFPIFSPNCTAFFPPSLFFFSLSPLSFGNLSLRCQWEKKTLCLHGWTDKGGKYIEREEKNRFFLRQNCLCFPPPPKKKSFHFCSTQHLSMYFNAVYSEILINTLCLHVEIPPCCTSPSSFPKFCGIFSPSSPNVFFWLGTPLLSSLLLSPLLALLLANSEKEREGGEGGKSIQIRTAHFDFFLCLCWGGGGGGERSVFPCSNFTSACEGRSHRQAEKI